MSTSAASAVKPASVILGTTAGSVTFDAYDIAMTLSGSNYVGYGLGMTSGSSPATGTLYKAVIPVSVITANDNSSAWIATIANARDRHLCNRDPLSFGTNTGEYR